MAVFRLILYLIVLSLIFIAVLFFFDQNSSKTGGQLIMLHIETFAVYAAVCILIALIVMLRWAFEAYTVYDGRLVHRRGIIFRKTETYSLQNMEEVSIQEGFIGRIMKHGTIVLHNPLLHTPVTLATITDPTIQADAIRSAIGMEMDNKIIPLPQ